MYTIPLGGRFRFCALPDTPEMEGRLSAFLAKGVSWASFLEEFGDDLVGGVPILGVDMTIGKTFLSSSGGFPQIRFEGDPRSLLFVRGPYNILEGGELSGRELYQSYFRWGIDPPYLVGDEGGISGLLDRLSGLESRVGALGSIPDLERRLARAEALLERLSEISDPEDVALPAIAAEAQERERQIRSLQQQINELSVVENIGGIDPVNYVRRDELLDLLSPKVSRGDLDAAIASRASSTDLDNHLLDDQNPHNVDYQQVGSPSRAEHDALRGDLNALLQRVSELEARQVVSSIEGSGGILAYPSGDAWVVDGSGLPLEERARELSLLSVGPVRQGEVLSWHPWWDVEVTMVRVSVTSPPEAELFFDLLSDGISVLRGNVLSIPPTGTTATLSFAEPVFLPAGSRLAAHSSAASQSAQNLSLQMLYRRSGV